MLISKSWLMRPPDGEGSKRWPEAWVPNVQIFQVKFSFHLGNCQGMAQWAKVSLVAIQKMIKDEFQAENWMATTEASGSASGDSGS